MKTIYSGLALFAAVAGFFGFGCVLVAGTGSGLMAEMIILVVVLVVSRLLPGPSVLWAELLGSVAAWPVVWRVLPAYVVYAGPDFLPAQIQLAMYGVLSLLVATLGPMLLLLLFGDLLDPKKN